MMWKTLLENFQNEEEGGSKVIFCVMDVAKYNKDGDHQEVS